MLQPSQAPPEPISKTNNDEIFQSESSLSNNDTISEENFENQLKSPKKKSLMGNKTDHTSQNPNSLENAIQNLKDVLHNINPGGGDVYYQIINGNKSMSKNVDSAKSKNVGKSELFLKHSFFLSNFCFVANLTCSTLKNHQIWQKMKKSRVRLGLNPLLHGTSKT